MTTTKEASRTAVGILGAALACCSVSTAWPQAPEPDSAAAAAVESVDEGGTLPALRHGRDALIDTHDFDGALNPAVAIVAAQEQEHDAGYAADLAALGLIRGELRQTEEAEKDLLEAIDIVKTGEGEYSPTLIDYYRGLGRAYIKGARYPEAIVTLEQAQHISQRHLGLFNVEQAPLLDDITTAYLGLGDTLEAQKTQLERVDNAIRRFGASDPRVIPYRYTLANYYERSRLPESAREQYEEVLKSQETRLGSTDPTLLAPLRQLVKIDLLVTQGADPASRDRLASLIEQNQDLDPIERGISRAMLGDWATVTGDTAAARSYYKDAWTDLSGSANVDLAGYFAKPMMLDFVAPLSPVDRAERRRPYVWAEVVLEFDVSAEGLPSSMKVVTSGEAPSGLQMRYNRRMRETHFRPRLVNGQPVATTNVRSTHYVRYYVESDE
jgi:tetratricopeptide (TPR) repeat protein